MEPPDTEAPRPFPLAVRLVLAGVAAAIAGWLLWAATTVHLQRACVVMDTPYLPLCPEPPDKRSPERQQQLRARLSANPGEAESWIQLTNIERGRYEKPLLRAASLLAPSDPNVLMWRAGELLARQQFQAAVDLLVQLVEYRKRAEAAAVLARVLASGQGTPLLRPHLPSAERWLPQVLASLTTLKLPLPSALPLIAEASSKGNISKLTTQRYIRSLRDAGQWSDAYALWLAQQRGATPLLRNGGFDEPFQQDGFDWEVTPALPSRAGALVSQRSGGSKGQALDIQFTGRSLAVPVIRQFVFAPPGNYLLRGQYLGSKLRVDEGLAWAARCTHGAAAPVAGRSTGLQDTAGGWKTFEFAIAVPLDCGVVISLQLETLAPSSAAAGIRGRVAFDSLELIHKSL